MRVYDPAANENAHRTYPDLQYVDGMPAAVADADVVALLTEWDEFSDADPDELGSLVNQKRIVDGRHALDADRYRGAGWEVRALGRPTDRVTSLSGSVVESAAD